MTHRERTLAYVILGFLILFGGAFMAYQFLLKPLIFSAATAGAALWLAGGFLSRTLPPLRRTLPPSARQYSASISAKCWLTMN